MPQMIFTLQNGSAVVMQSQPALVTGSGYAQTMQLVSPVALATNTAALPAQVSYLTSDLNVISE